MNQFENGTKPFRSLLLVGLNIEYLQNGLALALIYFLLFEPRNKYIAY